MTEKTRMILPAEIAAQRAKLEATGVKFDSVIKPEAPELKSVKAEAEKVSKALAEAEAKAVEAANKAELAREAAAKAATNEAAKKAAFGAAADTSANKTAAQMGKAENAYTKAQEATKAATQHAEKLSAEAAAQAGKQSVAKAAVNEAAKKVAFVEAALGNDVGKISKASHAYDVAKAQTEATKAGVNEAVKKAAFTAAVDGDKSVAKIAQAHNAHDAAQATSKTAKDAVKAAEAAAASGIVAQLMRGAKIIGGAGAVVGTWVGAKAIAERLDADDSQGAAKAAGRTVGEAGGFWASTAGGAALGTVSIPIPIVGTVIGAVGGATAGYFGAAPVLGAVGEWLGGKAVDGKDDKARADAIATMLEPTPGRVKPVASPELAIQAAVDAHAKAEQALQAAGAPYAKGKANVNEREKLAFGRAIIEYESARAAMLKAQGKPKETDEQFSNKVRELAEKGTEAARASNPAAAPAATAGGAIDPRQAAAIEALKVEIKAELDAIRKDEQAGQAAGGPKADAMTGAPKKDDKGGAAHTPKPTADSKDIIIVQKGDSLSKIARHNERLKEARKQVEKALNTTDELTVTLVLSMAMAKASDIAKPDLIFPGNKIEVAKVLEAIPDVAKTMQLHPKMKDDQKLSVDDFKDPVHGLIGKTITEILAAGKAK